MNNFLGLQIRVVASRKEVMFAEAGVGTENYCIFYNASSMRNYTGRPAFILLVHDETLIWAVVKDEGRHAKLSEKRGRAI